MAVMAGLGLTAMLLVGVVPVGAAPGDLDTTFSTDGKVTTTTATTTSPSATTVVPSTATTVAPPPATTRSPARGMVPPRPVYIG